MQATEKALQHGDALAARTPFQGNTGQRRQALSRRRTAEAYEALERYHHAGVRVPVLSPLGRKIDTIQALVKAAQ